MCCIVLMDGWVTHLTSSRKVLVVWHWWRHQTYKPLHNGLEMEGKVQLPINACIIKFFWRGYSAIYPTQLHLFLIIAYCILFCCCCIIVRVPIWSLFPPFSSFLLVTTNLQLIFKPFWFPFLGQNPDEVLAL